jgi:uncharacterized membrane protein YagU involved in acid resistance
MQSIVTGGIGGLVATAPMTVAMEAMHRQLPPREQYPLPPRQITENVAEEIGVGEHLDEGERVAATLVAHFAYGAAAGTVFSVIEKHLPGPAVVKGIGFGLAVWTGSYLGLLPATGLLSSAKHHPARRNALMIAAHVVWGAATGALTDVMAPRKSPTK